MSTTRGDCILAIEQSGILSPDLIEQAMTDIWSELRSNSYEIHKVRNE
jgi:hypothetical protein